MQLRVNSRRLEVPYGNSLRSRTEIIRASRQNTFREAICFYEHPGDPVPRVSSVFQRSDLSQQTRGRRYNRAVVSQILLSSARTKVRPLFFFSSNAPPTRIISEREYLQVISELIMTRPRATARVLFSTRPPQINRRIRLHFDAHGCTESSRTSGNIHH